MRSGNVLFSAVHLFVIFLIIGMGVLCTALPHVDGFRLYLADTLMHNPGIFLKCGEILLGSGCILFVGFYMLNRRRFYTVEMKGAKFSASEEVIKETVIRFWKRLFPEDPAPTEVFLNRSKEIEMILFCSKPFEEQEKFLARIHEELGILLKETLGYNRNLILNIC